MKIYSKDLITGEMKFMGEIPGGREWIMTDDQRNRLTSLAQEIALENNLSLSIHIDKDGLNIGLYNIVETEEEVEEE